MTLSTSPSLPPLRQMRVGGAVLSFPVSLRNPEPHGMTVRAYMALIGLSDDPHAERRLHQWLTTGRMVGTVYGGHLYIPRPSYRRPPPGYIPVRRWAARRTISDQRAYLLIAEGRVSPVWRFRVRRYQHVFVAAWAEVKDAGA